MPHTHPGDKVIHENGGLAAVTRHLRGPISSVYLSPIASLSSRPLSSVEVNAGV